MSGLLKRGFTAGNTVYGTGSPVQSGQRKRPRLLSKKQASEKNKSLSDRIGPLMEARAQANKVYSNSYFENHYPEADKDLKKRLDEKIMTAHSRLKADDDGDEQEEKNNSGITIVLNIGK